MISIERAKELLKSEEPVRYEGVIFKKINALIFRKQKNKIVARVELLDKSNRSAIIVRMDKIEEVEES